MSKDRTKHQDFKLVKEWITAVKQRSVIQLLADEKIDIRYFKKIFSQFFLSNYRSPKRGKEIVKKVTMRIVRKDLYSESTVDYYYSEELDKTNEFFRDSTIEQAIELFVKIRQENENMINGIQSFFEKEEMKSASFSCFCWRYNLSASKERATKTKNEDCKKIRTIKRNENEFLERQRKEKHKYSQSLKRQKESESISDWEKMIILQNIQKKHFKGRNYTQENLTQLHKMDCLDENLIYNPEKVFFKIEQLQKSIQ